MSNPLVKKRCLLWDWTNTANVPTAIDKIDFSGPISSVANWNTWTPPELRNRVPFRPTVRTPAQLEGDEWKNLLGSIDANTNTTSGSAQPVIVHFFNEPERAGVTVAAAATAWTAQMLPLRASRAPGTLKLVGPSCASDPAGTKWLEEFMTAIGAPPQDPSSTSTTGAAAATTTTTGPDFLGLHYYGADDGSGAMHYLEDMHARWPALPVIVSEIASTSRARDGVWAFTARVANWMDGEEWVFEYAFFGCMREVADGFVSPEAQLMDGRGELTELTGKLMREVPVVV